MKNLYNNSQCSNSIQPTNDGFAKYFDLFRSAGVADLGYLACTSVKLALMALVQDLLLDFQKYFEKSSNLTVEAKSQSI